MNPIKAALTSLALLIGSTTSTAMAGLEFVRTNETPFISWTKYASLAEMAADVAGSFAGNISPAIPAKDSMFTDGVFFYKVTANGEGKAGQFNNLIVRYQSLADLNSNTGGEAFNMVGYGMYYDDEIIADNLTGRFLRTTRYFPDSPVTVGMYAYNSFADLVNNNAFYAGGFTNQTVAFDCKFWAADGKYYRTNVAGKTGNTTVTGVNVYNSSEDLYNGVVAETIPSKVGAPGSMRYLAVDSSLIPRTPCPGDIDGDGQVGASDLALLLSVWGVCPK